MIHTPFYGLHSISPICRTNTSSLQPSCYDSCIRQLIRLTRPVVLQDKTPPGISESCSSAFSQQNCLLNSSSERHSQPQEKKVRATVAAARRG